MYIDIYLSIGTYILTITVMEQLNSFLVWAGIRDAPPAEKLTAWRWTKAYASEMCESAWNVIVDQNKYEMSIGLLAITASCFFIYTAFKLRR